jgi:hypothetical protein
MGSKTHITEDVKQEEREKQRSEAEVAFMRASCIPGLRQP